MPAQNLGIMKLSDGAVTHLKFPNQPLIRVRNLKIPEGARVTKGSLSRDGDGWRVSLGLVTPAKPAPAPVVDSVGMDVGLRVLAYAASDATGFEIVANNPRPLQQAEQRLARSQRKLSRRRQGSVGRRRAAREVARRHKRVADLRAAHHHRVSRRIVNAAGAITVETLSVQAMMRTRLAKSVTDAAPGGLLRQLAYKAAWAGRRFTALGRWDRSTGCCPDCGRVGRRLPMGQDVWTCPSCGTVHDRDRAAARWLDRCGIEIRSSEAAHAADEGGRRSPEPAPKVPKRGSAGGVKEWPRRSAASGPPANVPSAADQTARASTG